MRAGELRENTVEELLQREQDLRKELFNLRFQAATGEIENPRRIRQVRKDIARVMTVAAQKKRQQAASEVGK